MPKFQASKAPRAAAALIAAVVLATGLVTSTASMAGSNVFDKKFASVIAQAKADPNYKSIPLATSDRAWFYSESEDLWKKKITKEQYVADGSKQYPGFEASFGELADLLIAS